MRAGNEHHVALSDAAMVIFEKMAAIRSGEFVSPGPGGDRPISDMSMLTLLRRIGRDDPTVHGFRSAFSDWCAEQTYFVSEAHEMALAQAVDNSMEFAYCRNDLFLTRRQLAEAWACHCENREPGGTEAVPLGATSYAMELERRNLGPRSSRAFVRCGRNVRPDI